MLGVILMQYGRALVCMDLIFSFIFRALNAMLSYSPCQAEARLSLCVYRR